MRNRVFGDQPSRAGNESMWFECASPPLKQARPGMILEQLRVANVAPQGVH
jgi:hypothetical protein